MEELSTRSCISFPSELNYAGVGSELIRIYKHLIKALAMIYDGLSLTIRVKRSSCQDDSFWM